MFIYVNQNAYDIVRTLYYCFLRQHSCNRHFDINIDRGDNVGARRCMFRDLDLTSNEIFRIFS